MSSSLNNSEGDNDGYASLWRYGDFLRLWTGTSISLLGTSISNLALPLVAVLTLHTGATQMGFLGTLGLIPYLLVSLFAGVWLDRIRRRPVMIACDLGRALLLSTIPIAALFGRLTMDQIYVVAFLMGVFNVIFGVAYQAFLPSLIGNDWLVDGNAKIGASSAAVRVIGQGIGGTLVQALTAPFAIILDSVSYLASALSIVLIRSPEMVVRSPKSENTWRDLTEGLRVIARQPILRGLTQAWIVYEIAAGIIATVYMLYLVRDLGMGSAAIGVLGAVGSLSAFAGASLARRVVGVLGLGPAVWSAFLVVTVGASCMVLASVVRPAMYPLMLISAVLTGLALTSSGINQTSLRQSVTPADIQGRVGASFAFATSGIRPAGTLLGGFLGQAIGLRSTIIVALFATLLVAVLLIASPVRDVRSLAASVTPS